MGSAVSPADGARAEPESLLDVLARRGLPRVVRSVRYHRPRGPFCGVGDCTGCLVRADGRPNVRACRLPYSPTLRLGRGNGWPSDAFDLLAGFDVAYPHGIDTLHGFRRPAWARGLYHRVVRRLAGYSAAPAVSVGQGPLPDPIVRDAEVVVIGAGAEGRAAADRLAERGIRSVVLDRRSAALPSDRWELIAGATASFLPPPAAGVRPYTVLAVREPGTGVLVRARAVIVATGSYDAALGFEGNDRPGVVAADLGLRWARDGRRSPLRRAVVVGGGTRAAEVVERLGRSVAAVIAPGEIGPDVVARASAVGAALYPRSLLLRALGRRRVRAVELRPRGRDGRMAVPCDGIVLAQRRLPHGQLLAQAGARTVWDPGRNGTVAQAGPRGATTVAGLFVAGSAGPTGAGGAAVRGADAADAAAEGAAPFAPTPGGTAPPPGDLEGYYRELLREPRRGKWVACPCEDVLLDEVERASADGYTGIEVVKRYTGLGTGLCQGRYCLPEAAIVLGLLERRPPSEVGSITPRPPAVPASLAALAALAPECAGEAVVE